MRNTELRKQYASIQSLVQNTSVATGGNINLQNHWGKYICVLTAGLLENSIKEIYGEFIRNTATNAKNSQAVAKYAAARLESIRNPKSGRFVQTAQAFSEVWGRELKTYLNESNGHRKNAIDSIMDNRHRIAHGKNVTISLTRVTEYLKTASEVIDYIEWQCDGN